MIRRVRKHNILQLFLFIIVSLSTSLQAAEPDDIAISVESKSVALKPQIPLTPEEATWLGEHKIIRVAGPKAFPPFHYYEKDGTVKGIASDYIKFIMELLGVQIVIERSLPWPEVLRKARQKKIDVISCAAKTAERESYLSFSNPYLTFPLVIVSRRDGPFISGIDDLHGVKVALTKKVSTYEWLKRDKIDVIPYFVKTPLKGLKAVSVGLADACIGNLAAVSYMIEKNGLANLKIAAPTDYGSYNLYIAVRKDWPQLVSIINKALSAMTPEQHAVIRNKLLPVRYEHGIKKADLLKWGLGITGIVALIFIVILFWNRTLSREIRERKQAEEALRESERRFREMADLLPSSICEMDLNLKLTYVNNLGLETFGYTQDEFDAGFSGMDIIHPEDREKVATHLGQIVNGTEIGLIEYRMTKKDGTKLVALVNTSPIYEDGQISGVRASVTDITEQKKLQGELLRVNKMESIATLAGGIAHEFNNTLIGIMGNIELLKMNSPEDERIDKYLETMKSAGHRMSRLTAQLLAYAEGGKYQPKNLKLDDFVVETLPILQHDLNPALRVETHFPRDISYISADNAQMQMILSAILSNSNEAIEDKGLIRITAENKDVDDDFTKQHPGLEPGSYVCLTVEDDGKGMDEETKDGIFEPFFTTKFQGRGMGMAAVFGIVKNHNGQIFVDSELGKGTLVRIYLPAIEVEIEKPKKASAEVATGAGTILMIEDEDVVIEVTQAMLERLGYRVMVAKSGKDAIHIAETFDGQIDLALLDIKLPDIDGRNLYPLVMKARSNLKVIVFSGYSIDGPAREILDAGAQDFIQKPFSIATLSEKLKAVLEGK